jgi:phosphate/sulfate permease
MRTHALGWQNMHICLIESASARLSLPAQPQDYVHQPDLTYRHSAPAILPAVGSIIGFALAFGGTGAVQWARPDPRSFPPYRGIVPIVLSWVVSPILTGAVAAAVFGLTRWLVLRREQAAKLAFWVLPPAVLITVMINVFFVCKCRLLVNQQSNMD